MGKIYSRQQYSASIIGDNAILFWLNTKIMR